MAPLGWLVDGGILGAGIVTIDTWRELGWLVGEISVDGRSIL